MMRRQFIFKHILFTNLEETSVLNKHLHSSKLYQLICTEQILLPNGESITCLHEWSVEKGTDSSLPHMGAWVLTAGLLSRSCSFGPCFLIDQHLFLSGKLECSRAYYTSELTQAESIQTRLWICYNRVLSYCHFPSEHFLCLLHEVGGITTLEF